MLYRLSLLIIITQLCVLYTEPLLAQRSRRSRTYQKPPQKKVYRARILKRKQQIGLNASVNYFGTGLGLDYAYRWNSYLELAGQIAFSQAKLEGTTSFDNEEFLNGSMTRLSFTPRIYYFRQLYIGLGINGAILEGDYGFRGGAVENGELRASFVGYYAFADIFLGSEWKWNRFYLGFDWFGFAYFLQEVDFSIDQVAGLNEASRLLTGDAVDSRVAGELAQQLSVYYGVIHFGFRF